MIELRAGTRIWLAAGGTDMRRGDLVKVLRCDGDGLCLFAKRLERGRFIWPQAQEGTVSLSRAQLSMLLEGIDWRRPPGQRCYSACATVQWPSAIA